MLKQFINIIKQKNGMSLVEVLTAMTILTLMIFCFAPLFLSYFNSIDIAGDKIDEVYHEASIMQRVIGNMNKSQNEDSDGYITPFQNIPLTLESEDGVSILKTKDLENVGNGSIVESDGGKSISQGAIIKTKAADANGQLTDISGGLLLSNPNDMDSSLMTFYASRIDSGFYCYPNSITDDFIKKDIVVIAKGMAASMANFEVYVNVDQETVSNNTDLYERYDSKFGGKLKGDSDGNNVIMAGVSWSIAPLPGLSDAFVLTVYGGRGISFENSPLIIKYGVEYKTVEVDSPMMIMVGEANKNGEYNYYVSRGEVVDANSNGTADTLAILQRTMKGDAPLTSAMNDVEWVDEESADNYAANKKIDGTKYGYYIMCGDNGQVRRFWRNADSYDPVSKTTSYGNYYWGGDYTYYTDYNLDRFSGQNPYMNTTDANGNASTEKVLSTDVSFKYIAMRPMQWESGKTPDGNDASAGDRRFRTGFNMSSKKYTTVSIINTGTAHLRNLCTVSATYGNDVQFYASDGRLAPYIGIIEEYEGATECDGKIKGGTQKKYSACAVVPSYDDAIKWQTQTTDKTYESSKNILVFSPATAGLTFSSNEAWGWLDPSQGPSGGTTNSYFKLYGLVDGSGKPTVNTASYPITLTSVDAIRITGANQGVPTSYETDVKNTSKSHYFVSGVVRDTDTSGDATAGTNASGNTTMQSNFTYPTSNYNLYCGYIPAYMDAWGSTTGGAGYAYDMRFDQIYSKTQEQSAFSALNSNIGRASNRQTLLNNTEYSTLWRMTMGITPYYSGNSLNFNKAEGQGQAAYLHQYAQNASYAGGVVTQFQNAVLYYPYTNLEYAITGKFYDVYTYQNNASKIESLFPGIANNSSLHLATPSVLVSDVNTIQNNVTSGKVIDITISYLSDPLAVAISANPTDDKVYDLANNKDGGQVFYWHNRREAVTFLDSASTVIPSADKDIPVSLMVGYVLGGSVLYGDSVDTASVDVTAVMNNGIVFLRAGDFEAKKHDSSNAETGEYKTVDNTGYKLDKESNVFHQFYYLNSHHEGYSTFYKDEKPADPSKGKHIGNIFGARYWQNNRHIIQRSITGGTPSKGNDGSYEYLRAHPMSDTKVNCVAWGTTWNGNPEAMWGTDNGTVLSWWIDTAVIQGSHSKNDWNDKSVCAEIQSYKWIDNTDGKTYSAKTSDWIGTIGSAKIGSGKADATTFTPGADRFKYFYDKGTQEKQTWASFGFINTLENINDIQFANDIWVAVGNQSDKDPADYSASGSGEQKNVGLKANKYWQIIRAYSDYPNNSGRGGSWVNVRYWVDLGNGVQSDTNSTYYWRAVQITKRENCNIVQINNVNGMWIATGYEDDNNNDQFDMGEKPVVCWAYDPLVPCGEDTALGGWSDKVAFYPEGATDETDYLAAYNGTSWAEQAGTDGVDAIGGINSCATRT